VPEEKLRLKFQFRNARLITSIGFSGVRWRTDRILQSDLNQFLKQNSCNKQESTSRGDSLTKWGLFTDADFVSQAWVRAQILVEESERYSAILMR